MGAPVSAVYPDLSSRQVEVEVDAINSSLGTQLPAAQVPLLYTRDTVLQTRGGTVVTSPLWTATQQVDQAILLLTRDHRTLLSAPWLLTDQVAELLSRMALAGEVAGDGGVVRVSVPPTRSDVLHACDVAEVRFCAPCCLVLALFCGLMAPIVGHACCLLILLSCAGAPYTLKPIADA